MNEMNYYIQAESDFADLEFDRLQRKIEGSTLSMARNVPLEISPVDCLDLVTTALKPAGTPRFYAIDGWQYVFEIVRNGFTVGVALLQLDSHRDRSAKANPFEKRKIFIILNIAVHRDFAEPVSCALDNQLKPCQLAVVTWCYRSDSRTEHRDVLLEEAPPALSEFYPWIAEGTEAYLNRYMASSASILFIEGLPGTGKTSLLRWLIWRSRLHAFLTYDSDLIASDEMFVRFLFSDADLLIVEDADEMLSSREHAGNKIVARFLGVSDGVIKLPQKKIVFTSNISDLSKVDSALLRPGRCFDVLSCRKLTFNEAVKAAAAAGISAPPASGPDKLTLAELFNPNEGAEKHRKTGY